MQTEETNFLRIFLTWPQERQERLLTLMLDLFGEPTKAKPAKVVKRTLNRNAKVDIINLMSTKPEKTWTLIQIARGIKSNSHAVGQHLQAMVKLGSVIRPKKGSYQLNQMR